MSDEFVEEWCGICHSAWTRKKDDSASHQCEHAKSVPAPRPIPASIFADLSSIGERVKEIRREESRVTVEVKPSTEHNNC
jgi:hypothetical protein